MTDNFRSRPVPRAGFEQVSIYDGDISSCPIDLSDNTNLWGIAPSAHQALENFSFSEVRRYPSAYSSELKDCIARYTSVDASMVVTGCGSDDVLDCAIRAFGNHKGVLTCCNPTFSMIPVLARINGVGIVSIPFDAAGDIPVDDMLSANPDIVYICSPNNPTGAPASMERIRGVADQFSGLVIVDCAYAEYSATSLTSLLSECDNILIARTMSKAFGMAGLRVGYALGCPSIVAEVEKSRGPYKVNALGASAAIAAIENDLPWIRGIVDETIVNRTRLANRLEGLGYPPLQSDANFILLPCTDSVAVAHRMLASGVATRVFSDLPGIGAALRVTIGPWEMMEAFLKSFEESLP